MNHITQEQAVALARKTHMKEIMWMTSDAEELKAIHELCNAAIEWYLQQAAKEQDIPQILEQLANEPPISGNHMAQARVLLAADMYKKDQKTNTSQERVQKTAKSIQVPLTEDEIFRALGDDIDAMTDAKADRESWTVIVDMVRAIEKAHGIGGQQ